MSADLNKAEARKAAAMSRAVAFELEDAAAANARLTGVLAGLEGLMLSGYAAMRSELDPLAAMQAHNGPCCLPVVREKAQPLEFRAWVPGAPLIPGAYGARVPENGALVVPQVLIVPLLSFDRRGYRLGYGGGFYDRTLQALRGQGAVVAIGLAFDGQEVDEVPLEPTDEPLDLIITPTRLLGPAAL